MKLYEALVIEATQCPAEDAKGIEEMMRETYRTLDHLDRATFFREARKCWKEYQLLDAGTKQYYRNGF